MRQRLLAILAVGVLAGLVAPVGAQENKWDLATVERLVQPMQHTMEGRLPLLVWNLPLPRDDKLVTMREDGSLRKAIEMLAARGIVPTVEMGWEWTPAGAMAMARTLQEAGRPVHVLMAEGIVGGEEELYRKSPRFVGPWPLDKEGNLTWKGEREWPCLPVYDVSKSVAFYREWMKKLKEAGVEVAAVWTDYEALPYPWNFVYESQKKPGCAEKYPPGALDSWQTFATYVYEIRSRMLVEAVADPVHEFYPNALVGNYSENASSLEYPFVGTLGEILPPMTVGGLSAVMPSVYPDTGALKRYYNMDWPVTQEDADNVFFTTLLTTISTSMANKGDKLGIPYVCKFLPGSEEPRYLYSMTTGAYRELLRHAWLRGTDGMYLFNLGYGRLPTAEQSLVSVEDARAVMDEMLEYREFLEQGKPMNYDLPAMRTHGIVWSGLALPNKVLVRTFTFGPEPKKLDLVPFPGVAVKLLATNSGATYLVEKSGKVKRVKVGLG